MSNGRPDRGRRPTLRRALTLATLSALVATGAGCQQFPVRHTEVEPEATAQPRTVVESSTPEPDRPAEIAPLPASPLAPGNLTGPRRTAEPAASEPPASAATPLLDAALARAEGVQEATTGAVPLELPVPVEPPHESAPTPGAGPVEPAPATPPPSAPAPEPSPPQESEPAQDEVAPPVMPPLVEEAPERGPELLSNTPPPDPAELLAAPAETPAESGPAPTRAIDPEKSVEPVANRDEWADCLSRLRELARLHAGEPGDAAEAWAIRARVLDWLAGDGDDPRAGNAHAWNSVLAALATATSPETLDEALVAHNLDAAVAALDAFAPLRVSTLALCRKIQGFAQYEPLDAPKTRAGRSVLVYCEMVGLSYEEVADGYRSRLASRVELVPAAGGEAVWSQALGTAEDRCRRRRRDYYVNYRLTLPPTVAAGAYSLRLSQTDLLSGHSVSASVDLTVDP